MTFTPAAADTIHAFLEDSRTDPSEYDLILTGDLGVVGSKLLIRLLLEKYDVDIRGVHKDCGNMIFDAKRQDVHAGGSGCACSGAVVCSRILNQLESGILQRVLFVGTGALMSPLVSLQGESIPSIAHGIELISAKAGVKNG